MVKSPMYRDTPLYWFMALSVVALATIQLVSRPASAAESMEITFAGSCCDGSECPIAKAVGAESNVLHRYSESQTTITLQALSGTTPRRLWEAVEGAKRTPVRLTSGNREFVSKPSR